jgi:hypothetical protein
LKAFLASVRRSTFGAFKSAMASVSFSQGAKAARMQEVRI